MECKYRIEREVVNNKKTDKVNIFIEYLSCDMIDNALTTTIFAFYSAYCEKYPNAHMYPERVKEFAEKLLDAAVKASREFHESLEEMEEKWKA